MTLDSIKEAIEHLPLEEQRALADWFEEIHGAWVWIGTHADYDNLLR